MGVLPIRRQDNSENNAVSRLTGVDSKHSDGEAKTLAGFAIEGVWNSLAGKPTSQKERVDRAQRADEYAELAADTMATIPRFKTVTGALARGVLLADVSGNLSVSQWTANLAANVAEGAMLNRAGKLASADGFLAKSLSSKLSSPLAGEMAMHAASGAGFGAVKAGFNISGARDSNGQFSTARYLENLVLSTTTGAVIGVPAGALGSRAGKVVSERFGITTETSLLGQSMRHAATGAAGGFTGGAVFGGVDSLRDARSLSDILAGTLRGATVGVLTGGVTGAFETRSLPFALAPDKAKFNAEPLRVASEKSPPNSDLSEDHLIAKREFDVSKTRNLPHSDLLALNFYNSHLLETRLTEMDGHFKKVGTETRIYFDPPENVPTSFESFKAFAEHMKAKLGEFGVRNYIDLARPVNREVNLYESNQFGSRVAIPADYDRQLDEVRQLRRQTEVRTPFHDLDPFVVRQVIPDLAKGDASGLVGHLTPEQIKESIPYFQAYEKLQRHPLGNRLLPEDVLKLMDYAPNPTLIKEVTIYDRPDYQNAFHAYNLDKPGFAAAADARPGGGMHFYQADRGSTTVETFFHEWSHLAKWSSPELGRFFDMATAVDRIGFQTDHRATRQARETTANHPDVMREGIYFPREYAATNQEENWAVAFGDHIMTGDADLMHMYVEQAPVRALVMSSSLEAQLKYYAGADTNRYLDNFKERVRYIDAVARPLATETLLGHLQAGSVEERAMAARLLGFYGLPEAKEALLRAGLDPANRVLPGEVSLAGRGIESANTFPVNSPRKPMTVAQTALEALYRLSGDTEKARLQGIVQEAMRNPGLRAAWLDNWMELPLRNQAYRSFMELYDKPGALVPMQRLIETRFSDDAYGRNLAFREIMRQTSSDLDQQTGYLLRNLQFVPGLRSQAVEQLATIVNSADMSSRARRRVIDYFADKGLRTGSRSVDDKIVEVYHDLQRQQRVEQALEAMASPYSDGLGAIQELGQLHEPRTISPLIHKAVSGNESVQRAAMQALQQFPATIVNFYARSLKHDYLTNPVMSRRLEEFMQRRGLYAPANYIAAPQPVQREPESQHQ